MRNLAFVLFAAASAMMLWAASGNTDHPTAKVALKPCHVEGVKEEVQCGVYNVFENRKKRTGRTLPLKIVVIPAKHPHPNDGPIFYMAGGPGEAATELASLIMEWGDNDEHEVVLIDERGTGEGNRLDCPSRNSDENLEAYLNGPFDPAAAHACRDELSRNHDLTQYSTPNFIGDIDEIRGAMGYERINLNAGSFGTYAALMYMRRYPQRVRCAYLSSLVPLANRVPLYHAEAAQMALDELFKECAEDSSCHAAYPHLKENFAAIIKQLHQKPALTSVRHPVTGARTEIRLSERAFADGLRVMMYHNPGAHEIPFLIEQAAGGDFTSFAEAALRANRDIYAGGGMGLHYAITCNEFVRRIRPDEVEPATRASFLGAWRVLDQISACEGWPRTELPADYFKPFRLETPAVLVSGEADATGSNGRWGKEVASFMPNAIHLIVPGGAHTPENECTRAIRHALFRAGTAKNLDTTCINKCKRPPFKLPVTASQ